jgi:hypothetical protein
MIISIMHLNEKINMPKILFIIVFIFTVFISSSISIATEMDNAAISGKITKSTFSTNQKEKVLSTEPSKEDKSPWWLKTLIEIVGIFAGIGIIVWQISKQHRSTLQIQKENFKEKLRLEIYQELVKHVDSTSSKLSSQIAKSMNIPISLETYRTQIAMGSSATPPRARASHFSEDHHSLQKSIARLFHIFERYTIAVPKFRIFQTGLNCAIYDYNEAFRPLFDKLLKYLPIDVLESDRRPGAPSVLVPAVLSGDELNTVKGLFHKYNEALNDITSYLYDLTVEAQNILLSSLFDNSVPPRQPLDPSVVVITTDEESIKKLDKYFDEETAWGRNKQQIKADVLSNISDSHDN